MIELRPITRDLANDCVRRWHRHHKPVRQRVLSVGAFIEGEIVGAAIVEPAKAEALSKNGVFEVTRLACRGGGATLNGHVDGVASKLLGAAWGAMRAMGCRRMCSYTRLDESGVCYRAAGWVAVAFSKGEAWDHGNKADRWLPGLYSPTTEVVDRVRWEIGPDAATTRVKPGDVFRGQVWRAAEVAA